MKDKNPTKRQIFCNNIKRLRKAKQLSLREMARKLEIGTASLIKIENGIIPPRLNVLIFFSLYDNLGVTPDQILSGEFLEEVDINSENDE